MCFFFLHFKRKIILNPKLKCNHEFLTSVTHVKNEQNAYFSVDSICYDELFQSIPLQNFGNVKIKDLLLEQTITTIK